ncbi:flavin reductase family protein [Glutamicibacter sp. MNS18]|uniref:flavin reductase family protein n=1 Tax=Glutamicibacter sp. MNS18 TaxID=2989817 RepID=UPI002235FAE3|nr:flavin reductase family protein [Glutamicibacter sp. MNS18]MCW4464638.1 flavin reductase family protein [Glutamicibacter sp. MNS18]
MSDVADDFRAAFRAHPAGVALITANPHGRPVGLTVSSLASLSVDPVAVSFSLTRSSGSAGAVLQAPTFMIHLLGEEHSELADAFARPDGQRFTAGQNWRELENGEPYFPLAPVAFRARMHSSLQVGPSRLIAAEVIDIHHGPASQHLLYQDRTYLGLSGARRLDPAKG